MTTNGKIKQYRHVSVFARSLDEVTQRLEDEMNKLAELGYVCAAEAKELNDPEQSGTGYAYVIHARYSEQSDPEDPAAGKVSFSSLQTKMQEILGKVGSKVGVKGVALVEYLRGKTEKGDWDDVASIIPKYLVQGIQMLHLTALEINSIADEFAAEAEQHAEMHPHDANECGYYRTFDHLSKAMRENARVNLQ